MSDETRHHYTAGMMADRLEEMRLILVDDQSRVGDMTPEQQQNAATNIAAAIGHIKSASHVA